ncbi:MAG: tetratricopeptide repeat protein [Candidatus Omnitrophota bacterium]
MNSSFKISFISIALIVVIGFAIYANSLQNQFVYDDDLLVKNNVFLTKLSNIKYLFTKEYYAGSGEFSYRPLTTLTFIIDYHFWKFNPVGYHLTNIFFHVLAGIALYFLVLLITPMLDAKLPARLVAALSGLFFIAHPVQTEVVNSPAFRGSAIFCALFFTAIIFYLKVKTSEGIKRTVFYACSLLFCFLAIFTRELAVGAVLLLVVIDVCTWKGGVDKSKLNNAIKNAIFIYAGYVAIAIFYEYISLVKFASPAVLFKTRLNTDLGYLVMMGSQYILHYLKLLLFPIQLSAEYVFRMSHSMLESQALFSFIAIAALILFVIRKFKQDRIFVFAMAWIFLSVGPTIAHPYTPVAERLLYPAVAGFSMLLSAVILRIYANKKYQQIAIAAASVIFIFYGWRTVTRNMDWRNPVVFWEERVRRPPATARSHVSLGTAYQDLKLYDKAEEQFTTAISIAPDYADAHLSLGNIYFEKGLYDKAIEETRKSEKLNPDVLTSHFNVANSYLKMGRYEDAIKEYGIFLDKQPFHLQANNNLGNIYFKMGRYDDAIKQFKKALQIKANYMDAWYNLANTYMAKGDYDAAINTYKDLLKEKPSNYKARNNLSNIYVKMGRYDDAINELKKAVEANPDFAGGYYNLGNAYYKKGLVDDAIASFEKAAKSDPKFLDAYNNLAVIYLKMGMKEKALRYWQKMLDVDPNNEKARNGIASVKGSF